MAVARVEALSPLRGEGVPVLQLSVQTLVELRPVLGGVVHQGCGLVEPHVLEAAVHHVESRPLLTDHEDPLIPRKGVRHKIDDDLRLSRARRPAHHQTLGRLCEPEHGVLTRIAGHHGLHGRFWQVSLQTADVRFRIRGPVRRCFEQIVDHAEIDFAPFRLVDQRFQIGVQRGTALGEDSEYHLGRQA